MGANGRPVRGLKLLPLSSCDGTTAVAIGPEVSGALLRAPSQLLLYRRGDEITLDEALVRTTAGDLRLRWAAGKLVSARAECPTCRSARELMPRTMGGAVEIPAELAAHRLVYCGGKCPWLPELEGLAQCKSCAARRSE